MDHEENVVVEREQEKRCSSHGAAPKHSGGTDGVGDGDSLSSGGEAFLEGFSDDGDIADVDVQAEELEAEYAAMLAEMSGEDSNEEDDMTSCPFDDEEQKGGISNDGKRVGSGTMEAIADTSPMTTPSKYREIKTTSATALVVSVDELETGTKTLAKVAGGNNVNLSCGEQSDVDDTLLAPPPHQSSSSPPPAPPSYHTFISSTNSSPHNVAFSPVARRGSGGTISRNGTDKIQGSSSRRAPPPNYEDVLRSTSGTASGRTVSSNGSTKEDLCNTLDRTDTGPLEGVLVVSPPSYTEEKDKHFANDNLPSSIPCSSPAPVSASPAITPTAATTPASTATAITIAAATTAASTATAITTAAATTPASTALASNTFVPPAPISGDSVSTASAKGNASPSESNSDSRSLGASTCMDSVQLSPQRRRVVALKREAIAAMKSGDKTKAMALLGRARALAAGNERESEYAKAEGTKSGSSTKGGELNAAPRSNANAALAKTNAKAASRASQASAKLKTKQKKRKTTRSRMANKEASTSPEKCIEHRRPSVQTPQTFPIAAGLVKSANAAKRRAIADMKAGNRKEAARHYATAKTLTALAEILPRLERAMMECQDEEQRALCAGTVLVDNSGKTQGGRSRSSRRESRSSRRSRGASSVASEASLAVSVTPRPIEKNDSGRNAALVTIAAIAAVAQSQGDATGAKTISSAATHWRKRRVEAAVHLKRALRLAVAIQAGKTSGAVLPVLALTEAEPQPFVISPPRPLRTSSLAAAADASQYSGILVRISNVHVVARVSGPSGSGRSSAGSGRRGACSESTSPDSSSLGIKNGIGEGRIGKNDERRAEAIRVRVWFVAEMGSNSSLGPASAKSTTGHFGPGNLLELDTTQDGVGTPSPTSKQKGPRGRRGNARGRTVTFCFARHSASISSSETPEYVASASDDSASSNCNEALLYVPVDRSNRRTVSLFSRRPRMKLRMYLGLDHGEPPSAAAHSGGPMLAVPGKDNGSIATSGESPEAKPKESGSGGLWKSIFGSRKERSSTKEPSTPDEAQIAAHEEGKREGTQYATTFGCVGRNGMVQDAPHIDPNVAFQAGSTVKVDVSDLFTHCFAPFGECGDRSVAPPAAEAHFNLRSSSSSMSSALGSLSADRGGGRCKDQARTSTVGHGGEDNKRRAAENIRTCVARTQQQQREAVTTALSDMAGFPVGSLSLYSASISVSAQCFLPINGVAEVSWWRRRELDVSWPSASSS